MSEQESVKAVRELLEAGFPSFTIEDRFDARAKAYSFRISGEDKTYRMAVTQEFLDGVELSEIGSRLSRLLLVEHLLDLPDTLVIVTSSGLKLEYE